MSILDVLRSGVRIADQITKPLQATVMYQRMTSADGYGPVHLPAVPLKAIVDYKAVQVRTREGTLSVTRAIITLLDVAEVKAATANQGIGNDDIFTLPDGDTGPILDIGGFVDAGDASLIPTTVLLG